MKPNAQDNLIMKKYADTILARLSHQSLFTAVTLKTGRWEVPSSNPGRACRPSRSEFSVVFLETRENTS